VVSVKVIIERLVYSGVAINLDTYSHVLPRMQEEAVKKFDRSMETALNGGQKIATFGFLSIDTHEIAKVVVTARTPVQKTVQTIEREVILAKH